ncbi:MAG: SPOCS domain-containing protein [Lachnotalea sp.]
MELIKKNIHMNGLKGKAVNQITLEDDYNVPDSKADVLNIIQENSNIDITEVKAADGHALVRGKLKFKILYVSDSSEDKIQSLSGEIPFEETINIEGAEDGDSIKIKWETEDFNVSMINSRKISIKAIITFILMVEQIVDEQTTVDISGENDVQCLNKGLDIVELAVNKKDIFRIKDEITVNSNKPNIYEIVWTSVQLRNTEIKLMDNTISIKGDLDIFVLYKGEDEERSLQWMETTLPFSGTVDCSGCHSDMISDVDVSIDHSDIEAKPDYDGEQRLINLDGALNLDIKLYEENHVDIVSDVYSPQMELTAVTQKGNFESLVVKNFAKLRVTDKIKIQNNQSRILQICHSTGNVKVDEVIPLEDAVSVEGVIEVCILYITADDTVPYNVVKGVIPFNHIVEAKGMNESSVYNVKADLEQLSSTMLDSEEIEVKAVINLNAIVLNKVVEDIITEVNESPLDYSKLETLPGIVGYIVKNDDTLWKLAKKYYTTVDKIKETNDMNNDFVKVGDSLLIVKNV